MSKDLVATTKSDSPCKGVKLDVNTDNFPIIMLLLNGEDCDAARAGLAVKQTVEYNNDAVARIGDNLFYFDRSLVRILLAIDKVFFGGKNGHIIGNAKERSNTVAPVGEVAMHEFINLLVRERIDAADKLDVAIYDSINILPREAVAVVGLLPAIAGAHSADGS